jgi:tellurite resistance protein TerC
MAFVGTKMVLIDVFKIPPVLSLGVIASILAVAILASWRKNKNAPVDDETTAPADAPQPPSPLPGR